MVNVSTADARLFIRKADRVGDQIVSFMGDSATQAGVAVKWLTEAIEKETPFIATQTACPQCGDNCRLGCCAPIGGASEMSCSTCGWRGSRMQAITTAKHSSTPKPVDVQAMANAAIEQVGGIVVFAERFGGRRAVSINDDADAAEIVYHFRKVVAGLLTEAIAASKGEK